MKLSPSPVFQQVAIDPFLPLPSTPTLCEILEKKTREIHKRVENHSYVQQLLNGKLNLLSYQQQLTDLRLVHKTLEMILIKTSKIDSDIKNIYFPALSRFQAIHTDLKSCYFVYSCSPSPAAVNYAKHLQDLAEENPKLLAAHLYVRVGGDLSGNVILKSFVQKIYPQAVNSFDFSAACKKMNVENEAELKKLFKERLNSLQLEKNEKLKEGLIQEASLAFAYAEKMFHASMIIKAKV